MTRHLPLHPHVPSSELARLSRQAPTSVEARRWQLLALIAEDRMTVKEAAPPVGLNYDYARRVVHRYNREGPRALRDRRRELRAPGTRPLLSPQQLQDLAAAVQGPAPGGGLWTGPLVARWMAETTGREHVAPQRGHEYLKRLRMSPHVPRPHHHDADPASHAAFQESFPNYVVAIRSNHGVWQFVDDPANPPAFHPREAAERVPLSQWQRVERTDSHGKELAHHVVELELGHTYGPRRNWRLIAATTDPRVLKEALAGNADSCLEIPLRQAV